MVKDLISGTTIKDQIFYCVSKKLGTSVKGDNYISAVFRDSSGTIDVKIWEVNDTTNVFEAKNFVCVSGNVVTFKDALQLNVTDIAVVDESAINIKDFCPITPQNIDNMLAEITSLANSIDNQYLKQLVNLFYGNEKFIAKFKSNSAAKMVHHAYIGGLLEHTLAVTKICDKMVELYPTANRDLTIAAALLHDIGKIKEISAFPDNDYTDDGILLGHIYIGTEMLELQSRKIEHFPRTLLNELKHCILSHHGKKEYGSPVLPSLIEAYLVHLADDMDAKMRRFSDLIDESDGNWSDRDDFFIGSKYRKSKVYDF